MSTARLSKLLDRITAKKDIYNNIYIYNAIPSRVVNEKYYILPNEIEYATWKAHHTPLPIQPEKTSDDIAQENILKQIAEKVAPENFKADEQSKASLTNNLYYDFVEAVRKGCELPQIKIALNWNNTPFYAPIVNRFLNDHRQDNNEKIKQMKEHLLLINITFYTPITKNINKLIMKNMNDAEALQALKYDLKIVGMDAVKDKPIRSQTDLISLRSLIESEIYRHMRLIHQYAGSFNFSEKEFTEILKGDHATAEKLLKRYQTEFMPKVDPQPQATEHHDLEVDNALKMFR